MGVCYLQHRIVTGLHANKVPSSESSHMKHYHQCCNRDNEGDDWEVWKTKILRNAKYVFLTFYVFLIITLLTVARNLHKSFIHHAKIMHIKCKFISVTTAGTHFGIRHLTSCWVLIIISYLARCNNAKMHSILKNFGISRSRCFRDSGRIAKLQVFLSFWTTIINLLLIVISLPAILGLKCMKISLTHKHLDTAIAPVYSSPNLYNSY